MRLSDRQRKAIREAVQTHFGTGADVYLFGSRIDDSRRGGDIDLLVELRDILPDSAEAFEAKLRTLADIHRRIGERKIDLVLAGPQSDKPIVAQARRQRLPV